MLDTMHREDIKAAIRKEYGSVTAFEMAFDLPSKSVCDFLRGRKSKRVFDAVEKVVKATRIPIKSDTSDGSSKMRPTHRLNRRAA